jgi:peptidoglycan/LPS O-acetylase OafA/YrhL
MLKSWPARLLLPAVFLLVFAYVSRVTAHPSRYWVGGVALMATAIVWVASYNGDYVLPRGRLKRAACWMGARSYGIYLIHVPAYYAAREIWFRLAPAVVGPGLHHMAILIATATPLTFLLAELNFRFVEDPLRRRGAQIAERMAQRKPDRLPEAVQPAG